MQSHRFALGEFVAFTEKRFPGLIWAAEWEIIALLEPTDGSPRYRIRGPDAVSNEVIPASSAAATHALATSFSTCDPWVSQLP